MTTKTRSAAALARLLPLMREAVADWRRLPTDEQDAWVGIGYGAEGYCKLFTRDRSRSIPGVTEALLREAWQAVQEVGE